MKITVLNGWNVGVERMVLRIPQENGPPKPADGWALVFQEVHPPTGDVIRFEMNEETKAAVVQQLTGIIVAGEIPQI